MEPLPESETEITEISKLVSSIQTSLYIRESATETRLRSQINGKSIVHIATTAKFPENNTLDFHRILLTPTSEDDGYVNAEEVHLMDLNSANLVVLSICNGGIYRFGPGD